MPRNLAWFLLVALPIFGWLIGAWFNPRPKLVWEKEFDSSKQVLGIGFTRDEQTILLSELDSEKGIGCKAIIALEALTGIQIVRRDLSKDRFGSVYSTPPSVQHLLTEGNSVNLASVNGKASVIVYDPLKDVILKQYLSYPVNNPRFQQNIMVATGAMADEPRLYYWKDGEVTPHSILFDYKINTHLSYSGASMDGQWVWAARHDMRASNAESHLILVDAQTSNIVQTIPGSFHDLHFATDSRSFIAIMFDTASKKFALKRFILNGKAFEPDPSFSGPELETGWPRSTRRFLYILSQNYQHPVRRKISSWLEKGGNSLLNFVWPKKELLTIYDRSNQYQKYAELSLPVSNGIPLLNEAGTHVAFCESNKVSYYELFPFARWYPMIGFASGLVASLFLLRKIRTK